VYETRNSVSRLVCDLCPPDDASVRTGTYTTAAYLRRDARQRSGWRRDKLNRDVCPRHPKLKGAR
jgi:hypothetical protein